MANLVEIRSAKETIANMLLSNQAIVSSLIEETDFDSDQDEIMYNIIYPYIYIDGTQTKAMSYICYEVNADSMDSEYWKNLEITIFVICHKDLMKTRFNGVRTDYIASEIDKVINGSKQLGARMNPVELDTCTSGVVNNDYCYRQLVYNVTDENNPLCE